MKELLRKYKVGIKSKGRDLLLWGIGFILIMLLFLYLDGDLSWVMFFALIGSFVVSGLIVLPCVEFIDKSLEPLDINDDKN